MSRLWKKIDIIQASEVKTLVAVWSDMAREHMIYELQQVVLANKQQHTSGKYVKEKHTHSKSELDSGY